MVGKRSDASGVTAKSWKQSGSRKRAKKAPEVVSEETGGELADQVSVQDSTGMDFGLDPQGCLMHTSMEMCRTVLTTGPAHQALVEHRSTGPTDSGDSWSQNTSLSSACDASAEASSVGKNLPDILLL